MHEVSALATSCSSCQLAVSALSMQVPSLQRGFRVGDLFPLSRVCQCRCNCHVLFVL